MNKFALELRHARRWIPGRRGISMIGVAVAAAAVLLAASPGYADIVGTSASVRSNNSLIVDLKVTTDDETTSGRGTKLFVTYQAAGVDPLVSRFIPVSSTGLTTITIGRLRADTTYTYTVDAIGHPGGRAETAYGSFTTGSLPAPLLLNTYRLTGRMTSPLVILPINQTNANGTFRGYVAFDLNAPDAPRIVWYYSNAPSVASGVPQVDTVGGIVQEPHGNFLFADGGSGGPITADVFYREIKPDGTIIRESPRTCYVTPGPEDGIWGRGNGFHEQLLPGVYGVYDTVLHLGQIVKDPFFDAGLAPQGARLQLGTTIRRWDPWTQTDLEVWNPFDFLDPLTERTTGMNSDPGANSNSRGLMRCATASLPIEQWTHANSLQVAPTGEVLMSLRHLDTVIAISPSFDRIAWRIGRFGSDFAFPEPSHKFYHEHFVRMLENGHLLLFDNGNGRPAGEGGQYSRALELVLNRDAMTATKVWEYRHPVGDGYKYADKVGIAQRLENGNTLVLFGADVDPSTLAVRNPQTFTLVEADASPEAAAVAVLDMLIPGSAVVYRALPVRTLFGER